MALHLWSLILWSCLGAFKQMVTGLLRNVVAKERDPAVADKATMMGMQRRLPIQLYHVIDLTCRRKVSLAVRRVFSFGFEAWKQLCREFECWVSSRFQWMLQAPLPSTRTDSPVLEIQRLSGDRTSENVELAVLQRYLCNGELAHRPDLQSGSPTTMCNLACDETTELIRAGCGCGARGPVATWQGQRRQEEPGRRQRCQDSETKGTFLLCDVQS